MLGIAYDNKKQAARPQVTGYITNHRPVELDIAYDIKRKAVQIQVIAYGNQSGSLSERHTCLNLISSVG